MSEPQVLVTGKYFTGQTVRAIGPVIEELILSAQREIHILAYLFTASTGVLLDHLENALAKGIRVTLVINDLHNCPDALKRRFREISQQYPHARVVGFTDPEGGQLHAKLVVADRANAVVGSANLTHGGMVSNHEIAVLLQGRPAWKLAELVDVLAASIQKGGS